jgi:hypothetical protein
MKQILLLLALVAINLTATSQIIPPPYINYQATLYDVNGPNPNAPYANQSFPAFVNIVNELGTLIYKEEHFASTDPNGLVTLKMGDGLYVAGTVTVFNNIPWTVNKYYLTIDFVINGVTSSTALEQLVTVPYAFHAGTAGNGISSVADNGNGTLTFTYVNGGTYTTPTLAGLTGPAGPTGPSGPAGPQGANGLSAYELWVAQGNTGTVTDFLNQSSYNIWLAQGNTGTQQQFLNSLMGPQGPVGATGPQGLAGTNGTNGLNALIKTSSEPAGANCTNGGTKIETGLDANSNGVLDVAEVNAAQTQYVCNNTGGAGGLAFSNMQVFATPGTYSWTCPVGVTKIIVEVWGAGGGGRYTGTGGGGGGYGKSILNVNSGNSYNIIVGAGGAGAPGLNTNGSPGGNSSFNNQITSTGGSGGVFTEPAQGGSSNATFTVAGEPGLGGSFGLQGGKGGMGGNGGQGSSSNGGRGGSFPGGGGGGCGNSLWPGGGANGCVIIYF